MKQNIGIVSTYFVGFILLNAVILVYAIINPGLFDNEDLLATVSIVSNIIFYFTTAIVIVILFRKYMFSQLKDFFKRFPKMVIVMFGGIIAIYGVGIIAGIILTWLNVTDEAANQQSINEMLNASSPIEFILMIIFITILAPIVEELVFRKGVYGIIGGLTMNSLSKRDQLSVKNPHMIASIFAIIVSSLAFGAIHATDAYLLVYGGLGVVLGLTYYFSNKNIIAAIGVHILYNSISLLLTIFILN